MEPRSFQELGSELINFEAKTGCSFTIESGDNKVSIKTDNDLSNPSLGTQFQTPVGQLCMARKGADFTELTFSPKLSLYDSSLKINFLTGQFKLTTKNFKDKGIGLSPFCLEIAGYIDFVLPIR